MNPFGWVKDFWKKRNTPKAETETAREDSVKIVLPGLYMSLKRPVGINQPPHEVSMFVPRAEFRKSIEEEGKRTTLEVILNSITIVHAPRHEPSGGNPCQAKHLTKID